MLLLTLAKTLVSTHMNAMAGNSEAANFFSEVERGVFAEGENASSCAGVPHKEAYDEDAREEWGLPSERASYGSRKLGIENDREHGAVFAQMKPLVDESYGSRRFLAAEKEGEGASSAQKRGMAEDNYGSRRFVLSCSMANERAKKKRRSRATSKAPIKVFSTDTSNFMAMVHKLTGIPSNGFPFHSPPPPPASSKLLPFNQGLPTLDTSTVLLPSFSCDRVSSYSDLQTSLTQQQFNSLCGDMQASDQADQALANMDAASLSYSNLMRSMCRVDASSLPCLWEASHIKQKSAAHKLQESCISERGGGSVARQEVLTDAWASSTSIVKSNIVKEELL